jgi:hypothetical protein
VKLLSDPYTDKPNVRLYGYQRFGGSRVDHSRVLDPWSDDERPPTRSIPSPITRLGGMGR